MEDNVSWPPHSNDCFCLWKHLLNHICITEALYRPQKPPNMVVYHGKFSQPYSQCPVWGRAYVRSRLLSLVVMSLSRQLLFKTLYMQGNFDFWTWIIEISVFRNQIVTLKFLEQLAKQRLTSGEAFLFLFWCTLLFHISKLTFDTFIFKIYSINNAMPENHNIKHL